jgi:hypothetical protein
MNAHRSCLASLLLAVPGSGCQPQAAVVLSPPARVALSAPAAAVVASPAVVPEVRDFKSTDETYSGVSPDDALVASASHDLACPRDSVRPIEWVAPSRTSEYAFEGCGKRVVYRWAYYRAGDYSPSRNHTVEKAILVNLFAVPR